MSKKQINIGNKETYRLVENMILDIEVDVSIKYGKLPSILIYNMDDYYSDIDVIDLLKNIESEVIEFYAA